MRRYLDRRLKFRHLRTLESLSTHKSLLKASKAMFVSQPALTRSLREAEEIIGTRLFERHSRGVTETDAGRVVAHSAREILLELRRLEGELNRLHDAAGDALVIGALPVAAAGLMPGVMARFHATHPAAKVRIIQGRTEELLPALEVGDLDFIVGRLYALPSEDSFQRTILYHEPISIIAREGHPLFDGRDINPSVIGEFKLVLPTTSQRVGLDIDAALASIDATIEPALRSSSISLIREMLYSTDFIAAVPQLMLAGDLLRGALRVVPLPVNAPSRAAGLIHRAGKTTMPVALAFVSALQHYLNELKMDA